MIWGDQTKLPAITALCPPLAIGIKGPYADRFVLDHVHNPALGLESSKDENVSGLVTRSQASG